MTTEIITTLTTENYFDLMHHIIESVKTSTYNKYKVVCPACILTIVTGNTKGYDYKQEVCACMNYRNGEEIDMATSYCIDNMSLDMVPSCINAFYNLKPKLKRDGNRRAEVVRLFDAFGTICGYL